MTRFVGETDVVQEVPSQCRTTPPSPAAQPSMEERMETARRFADVGEETVDQLEPFQRMRRPLLPTAQPSVALANDRAFSVSEVGEPKVDHEEPFQRAMTPDTPTAQASEDESVFTALSWLAVGLVARVQVVPVSRTIS